MSALEQGVRPRRRSAWKSLRPRAVLLPELLAKREKELAGGGVPLCQRVLAFIGDQWQKNTVLVDMFSDPELRDKGKMKVSGGHKSQWYRALSRLIDLGQVELASDGKALWVRLAQREKRVSN